MPSCIIEYADALSASVSPEKLTSTVHQAAIQSNLFKPVDIKTRAQAFSSYQVGEQDSAFIHVTVHLMPGRTDEQRQLLCQQIGQALHNLNLPSPLSITVQSSEIHKASYFKQLVT